MPVPRRGEIWTIDLGMVQKTRPAVILSVSFLDHERAVVTFVLPLVKLVRDLGAIARKWKLLSRLGLGCGETVSKPRANCRDSHCGASALAAF